MTSAAERLRAGELVAFPTETVYGLGADATCDEAVAGIFEAKGRPRFNPLIVHVRGRAMAAGYVEVDDRAEALMARFWPGPLTLVLPRRTDGGVSLLCSAGLDTLAVRCPAHPVATRLIAATERPLAAPSANASGRVSPTRAEHVVAELGERVSLVLDGGPCAVGLESTVVALGNTPRLLRPGAVTAEELSEVIGPVAAPTPPAAGRPLEAPGQLESHYAPAKAVRLNATTVEPGEGLLAFGEPVPGAKVVCQLSASGSLREAAAHLFASLRQLDDSDVSAIAVMPIPEEGLGLAINDRLRRAAAPRPERT